MSGGVDSSVAAYLLKREGYDVTGVFLRCWGGGDGPSASLGINPSTKLGINCAERDAEDARRVAGMLDIPFYVWDFEEEYKEKVVEYMIRGYREGITPNPDVACNREIKFGLFLDRALRLGADYVATGHYVRLGKSTHGKLGLFEAVDKTKDQSYFLWTLTEHDLVHSLFPIGAYEKKKVREIARRAGLPTASKKDSQGICFLGEVSIVDFLRQYIPSRRGAVVNTKNKVLGEHEGAHLYTIGQRHGIGNVKHQKGITNHVPLYVAEKDIEHNVVVVAEKDDRDALYRDEVVLGEVSWISREPMPGESLLARVRYRQPLHEAAIVSSAHNRSTIRFKSSQKFVAPGQSAVLYSQAGEMLGGGVIL